MDDTAQVTSPPIEETPIIEPIIDSSTPIALEKKLDAEIDLPDPLQTPELPSSSRMVGQKIRDVIIFVVLFCVGVVGSTFLRPYISSLIPGEKNITNTAVSPTPPVSLYADWKEYKVFTSKLTIIYKLPPTVEAPSCDGVGCSSQGTYLPGKTRFTISTKVLSTPIAEFSKLIVNDAQGHPFTSNVATVSGALAVSFSSSFTGVTTGGYTFSAMNGVMVQINPYVTLEINHFGPVGIETDFPRDDAVFAGILTTVRTEPISSSATGK